MLNNPLLPTAYLAPISYYEILLNHPNCTVEHYEYFVKQSIRNRCDIYSANGKLRLTIPKQKKGSSKTIIKDIKISYKENWQKDHWNSIISSYNSSPYFKYYKDDLLPFFKQKEIFLIDFNNKLQAAICSILKKGGNVQTTTEYLQKGNFTDLRNYRWDSEQQRRYDQVFMEKYGFISNLSILDLLFNLGPQSPQYLQRIII